MKNRLHLLLPLMLACLTAQVLGSPYVFDTAVYGGIALGEPYTMTVAGMLMKWGGRDAASLQTMTTGDKRNTLIEVLAEVASDSVSYIQGFDDAELVAAAAINLMLRETENRNLAWVRATSLDNQRNTIIVITNQELNIEISTLQAMDDGDLAQTALQWRNYYFNIVGIFNLQFQLPSGTIASTPQVVASQDYDNINSSVALAETFSYTEAQDVTYSFTFTDSTTFTLSDTLTETAGVPEIASESDALTLGLATTLSFTTTSATESSSTISVSSPVSVPPGKAIKIQAVLYVNNLNVPYTATVITQRGLQYDINGMWNGVEAIDYVVTQTDITPA